VPLLRTLCQIDPQWLFNTNVRTCHPLHACVLLPCYTLSWVSGGCVLSTTRAQTADACAARILVDTGKEDFIAFVMEQQVCSFPTSAPFNGCLPVHSPICPVV